MRQEQRLELELINKLEEMGYTYRNDITTITELNNNLKKQIEYWNQITLSTREFENILRDITGKSVFDSTSILHNKYTLLRDDDTYFNISFYDTKHWCQNTFEVIRQLKADNDQSFHRYDVHILINGIPMVHIELKYEGISPKNALKQIVRYKQDSGTALRTTLLGFTQIFIISNGTFTYYFVNNDKLEIDEKNNFIPVFQWADENNHKLTNLLLEFTPSFLEKCFLSRMIARFIVQIQVDKSLRILRPYQVHAVEKIIRQINESHSNGYIWHTTGSGKTLTSFKCATILRENENIHKVLFVVDRKDLDKQTIEEFNKFEEGSVDQTISTDKLLKKMLDPRVKIVVTTLQKLNRLLGTVITDSMSEKQKEYLSHRQELLKPIHDQKMVFIFDECHRSQFGESNKNIRKTFINSRMFGFTGTPIFDTNSKKIISQDQSSMKITTKDIFDEELHNYLIYHAIEDENVLPFHIEYFGTKELVNHASLDWKKEVISTIIEKHEQATVQKQFNSILTVSSINDAIFYYNEFKKQQQEKNSALNIACVFSPPPFIKTDLQDDMETEKEEYTQNNEQDQNFKKEALEQIIFDYNNRYNTSFNLKSTDESNNFIAYYGDISDRMKKHRNLREDHQVDQTIDVLIVVDMFLTGFDSQFINTLYVDKNLEYHGLIQAFSRTNRIFNASKPHGNIFCFRDLKSKVDDAIKLFSGKEEKGSERFFEAKSYQDLKNDYIMNVHRLKEMFAENDLPFNASSVANLSNKTEFYELFQTNVKLKNTADQYISEDTKEFQEILSDIEYKAFHRAFIEHRKDPFKQENSKDTPEESTSFDLQMELFHKDIIDRAYIENLIVDLVLSGKDIVHSGTKEEIFEKLFGDITQHDYASMAWRFVDQYVFKSQTRDEIIKDLREFERKESDQVWNRFAKSYDLDLGKLLELRDEYVKIGRMQQHMYPMINETFAHQDLGTFDKLYKSDEIGKLLEPLLIKTLEEHRTIQKAMRKS